MFLSHFWWQTMQTPENCDIFLRTCSFSLHDDVVFISFWQHPFRLRLFYLSHTQLYREYITSSEMYSLHLTHPKWTHTWSSGQPCYSARRAVGGSCSRTPQSWYWRRILPPPTISAGPEIRTHNLPVTSPTRYPLGHDCPLEDSLQRIHLWASDIMLNFTRSVPMKKQTHLGVRFQQIFFFGETIS